MEFIDQHQLAGLGFAPAKKNRLLIRRDTQPHIPFGEVRSHSGDLAGVVEELQRSGIGAKVDSVSDYIKAVQVNGRNDLGFFSAREGDLPQAGVGCFGLGVVRPSLDQPGKK